MKIYKIRCAGTWNIDTKDEKQIQRNVGKIMIGTGCITLATIAGVMLLNTVGLVDLPLLKTAIQPAINAFPGTLLDPAFAEPAINAFPATWIEPETVVPAFKIPTHL